MALIPTTHLNFRGQAREALTWYQQVVGGDLLLVTYADAAAGAALAGDVAEDELNQLIFGQVATESGFRIMAFDVPAARPFERGENSFFISVHATSEQELRALWDGLSDGAEVRTPLGPAMFSPLYGMLTDRFGVVWVVDLQTEQPG
ncbi:VOC family protein [Marmoricola endophyticus]|uniref:VOC family protein n=1 Tax=Marmoricola endophyticus TaxID=2040280 RepID=A0A917BNU0_9ACTN|nr:VOC family protein [Marmoricola endophyticus]GGF52038.1 VOC family protein [Marmoricola endophyticus]